MNKKIKEKLSLVNISAFLGTIIALITGFQFLLMPAIDSYAEGKIKEREEELIKEASGQVSFRTLLSQESGVPKDRIHIVYGEMYIKFREMMDQVEVLNSVIEKEQEEIDVGLVFYHGRLWWRWKDHDDYRIRKKEDLGFYWIDSIGTEHPVGLK